MLKGKWGLGFLVVLAVVGTAIAGTRSQWGPIFFPPKVVETDEHSSHLSHAHAAPLKGLVLSDAAKASLGLELSPIVLRDYWRSLPIPAEVMEEPGHCEQGVSSTVHGIVLKIHAFHGQTVRAGDPLFDIRPTSELLAATQSSLLKSIQEIELVQAELKRIAAISESGGIAATRRIEKENELKRQESQRLLLTQELLVRGLSAEQIDEIVRSKVLVQELTIRVPVGQASVDLQAKDHEPLDEAKPKNNTDGKPDSSGSTNTLHEHGSVYSIEQMNVHPGKLIQPGEELCRLARHSQLLIVGRAFESENFLVTRAIEKNWPVKAIFEVTDESPVIRDGLSILYSDNVVEPDSRTIRFYIPLPNELIRDQPSSNGLAYRSWRFKPGQRVKLMLPVEHSLKQIILPSEAVVKEGAESFVFRANGSRLERVPVRLSHLDSQDAVIKSGGSLAAGDVVARNQAYQLELALKNAQSGRTSGHGGHDHAGHSHDGHEH